MNHPDRISGANSSISEDSPRETANLYPRVTSFRSRRGALTTAQQRSWDSLWPAIGMDAWSATESTRPEFLDADSWFGRSAPLVLEIGCGTGTATAAMALAEPEVNLIGVEVYRPGLAQLVQFVERDHIPNIRVIRGDAMDVLENMLAPASLTGARVFFPDPWPKARHHKRRLLQATTFSLLASRIKPGGVLHVATDHAEYAEAIAEVGNGEPLFAPLTWVSPISHKRPITKFESKAEVAGSAITELIWGRINA